MNVYFKMFKIKRFLQETNVFRSCLFGFYYGSCSCSLPWPAVCFPQVHLVFLCLHISETAYPVLNPRKSLLPECPGLSSKGRSVLLFECLIWSAFSFYRSGMYKCQISHDTPCFPFFLCHFCTSDFLKFHIYLPGCLSAFVLSSC